MEIVTPNAPSAVIIAIDFLISSVFGDSLNLDILTLISWPF
ncbi:MAG: hypothetical protein P8Y97_17380 [Candidatus Lokiarchaeota archaeon]